MTVLVTGASGFLGAHTIPRLLDDGHRVRAYVRSPDRLAAALAPQGVDPATDDRVEVALGDMTDQAAIRAAVRGCRTVLHAAATYSLRRKDAAIMTRANVAGTRAVLTAAVDEGCSAVVHVSSTVALNRPGGSTLRPGMPLGPGLGPYSTSKVASERVARELQAAGAPVVVVNPGVVIGPQDPRLGASNAILVAALSGRMPALPRGGLHYVDVRDTAAVLAALAGDCGGQRPGHHLVPGEFLPAPHGLLEQVTGRRLRVRRVPTAVAVAAAQLGYWTGLPFLPGEPEGARILACANPGDASATVQSLGVEPRPLEDVFADTVRWLVEAAHLPPAAAGRLGTG